jgi:uncharacterized protein YjiS (DUF1127 family)
MEAPMSNTLMNPTSWIAIAERMAERQRRTTSSNELIMLGEREFSDAPLTKAEVRAEVLKWVWQH